MPSELERIQSLLVSRWMDQEGLPIHGIGMGAEDVFVVYHHGDLSDSLTLTIEVSALPFTVRFVRSPMPTVGPLLG